MSVRRSVRAAMAVWRRELQITLRAPIVYVVGGLFLAVQGIAFAGLVNALSDPTKAAPLGALLEGQLAGTLLTWVLQLVVLTLLGMRTIAEDKRSGAWELLLTAQVGEGAAVIGKWLAAATVYALLWLPTLAYLGLVSIYRVDEGGWDVPSIITGYAGAIAVGAALLAWAVAASAGTSTTLVAGAFAFALLMGLFLFGELPAAFPDLAVDHPVLARVMRAMSLRGQLTTFARGEISLEGVVFVGGLAVVGLSLAFALACTGRRRRVEQRNRVVATVLVAAIAVFAGVLAVRRPARWDVSSARRNSLDVTTREVLASLPAPVTLTIVRPTLAAVEPIYDEVTRVARRMADAGPVTVRHVDPATIPGGLEAAARVAGVMPDDLEAQGGVIVEVRGKRRVVDRVQLVSIAADDKGTAAVERLAIEQAITGALAQLIETVPITACATTGHGELPLEPAAQGADWSAVVERLRAEGIEVTSLEPGKPIPIACNVVIVAGPVSPLTADEALELQNALVVRRVGLVVAAASRPITAEAAALGQGGGEASNLATTGLEGFLATRGIGLPPAIVVDPGLTVREIRGGLLVVDGYAEHAINRGFANVRPTIWFQPRAVLASGAAQPLVSASSESWGERDTMHAPPQKEPDDIAGPVALAAVSGHVIAIGSAESFMTAVLRGSVSASDLWLARAIRHVAGKPAPEVAVAERSPDQVRLVLTSAQRKTVLVLSIAGIPLVWIVVGALLLVVRRRRDK